MPDYFIPGETGPDSPAGVTSPVIDANGNLYTPLSMVTVTSSPKKTQVGKISVLDKIINGANKIFGKIKMPEMQHSVADNTMLYLGAIVIGAVVLMSGKKGRGRRY